MAMRTASQLRTALIAECAAMDILMAAMDTYLTESPGTKSRDIAIRALSVAHEANRVAKLALEADLV